MKPMTQIDNGWGANPSQRYEELASRFHPLFQRIRAGAVEANWRGDCRWRK